MTHPDSKLNQHYSESLAETFVEAALAASDDHQDHLCNFLLHDAIAVQASDIHINSYFDRVHIRFRIMGELHLVATIPIEVGQHVINQLKVMAKLDPIARVLPGESRFSARVDGSNYDVRVTSILCHGGEKLHARLLRNDAGVFTLEKLGLSATQLELLNSWLEKPRGMLLVTGPSGAGKTTTLHALVQKIIETNQNVVSIEDPVEYDLPGATQIQVNERSGLTFAEGITTALRLDPDCLLIGELRDPESVRAAMIAASTGHLVFGALHTSEAAEAISVLRRFGAKNGPLSVELGLVIHQRLIPQLCMQCRYERCPHPEEQTAFESQGIEVPEHVFDTAGCDACRRTGLDGRTGVFEILQPDDEIKDKIAKGQDVSAITSALRKKGHLLHSAHHEEKARAGLVRYANFPH